MATCTISPFGTHDCPHPLDGDWFLHRSISGASMFDSNTDLITFAPWTSAPDGDASYTWYSSNQQTPSGAPILEIGLKVEEDGRVLLKFRGWVAWNIASGNAQYTPFHSYDMELDHGYDTPSAVLIMTGYTGECYVFDGIDLGAVCEAGTQCVWRGESERIAAVILQRRGFVCGNDAYGIGYDYDTGENCVCARFAPGCTLP